MTVHLLLRPSLLTGALLLAGAAQAQQAYDLRVLSVAVNFPCCNPDAAAIHVTDKFNNGAPLTGPAYDATTGLTGNMAYSVLGTGFSAGSELSSAATDVPGTLYDVGSLRFSVADATPTPSSLDAAGTQSLSNRLTLNNPGAGSLLNKAQSFEVSTGWNFTTPDAGTTYGTRLSDNPFLVATPGTPFNDVIDLRVVRNGAGQAVVNLRRLAYDGSVLSAPESYNQLASSALTAGHTLAEVKFIELNLHYNTGIGAQPYLLANYYLNDAGLNTIGTGSFSQQLTLFNGEDVTRVSASAGFTQAVPEPTSLLLMLGGMALLGGAGRRR